MDSDGTSGSGATDRKNFSTSAVRRQVINRIHRLSHRKALPTAFFRPIPWIFARKPNGFQQAVEKRCGKPKARKTRKSTQNFVHSDEFSLFSSFYLTNETTLFKIGFGMSVQSDGKRLFIFYEYFSPSASPRSRTRSRCFRSRFHARSGSSSAEALSDVSERFPF